MTPPSATSSSRPSHLPILGEAEADRRMFLLAQLHAALEAQQFHCVLARKHRLVLRYSTLQREPSGLTDPELHAFGQDSTDIITTDGTTYTLASGQQYPTADPDAAARKIGAARAPHRDADQAK